MIHFPALFFFNVVTKQLEFVVPKGCMSCSNLQFMAEEINEMEDWMIFTV